MNERPSIAIIGGTGQEGGGLAARFASAGFRVIIGSRDAVRAGQAAADIAAKAGGDLHGAENLAAAWSAEIVILTVPYAMQAAMARQLANALSGKILVDATVPLMPPRVSKVQLPEAGSAVAALQELLGPQVRVVSAFQNVSHAHLHDLDHEVECDVLVCGNDAEACDTVVGLARAIGIRAFHAGGIENSAAAEALTSVLIFINRKYKSPGAGIRLTAVPHGE